MDCETPAARATSTLVTLGSPAGDGRESASLGGLTGPHDLVEETVALGGRDLAVLRPRDSEALLDERGVRARGVPARTGPSCGRAASRSPARVAARALHGARTLELGCGLALPSMAAVLAGGRVLATDWSPRRGRGSRARTPRATASTLEVLALLVDATRSRCWRARRGIWCSAPTCSTSAATPSCCSRCCRGWRATRREIWIADPGRPPARGFFERAREHFEVRRAARRTVLPQRRHPRLTARPGKLQATMTNERRPRSCGACTRRPSCWCSSTCGTPSAPGRSRPRPECRALATASWSIAAAHGVPDGEAAPARGDAGGRGDDRRRGRRPRHRRPRGRLRRGRGRGRRDDRRRASRRARSAATSRTARATRTSRCARRPSTPRGSRPPARPASARACRS